VHCEKMCGHDLGVTTCTSHETRSNLPRTTCISTQGRGNSQDVCTLGGVNASVTDFDLMVKLHTVMMTFGDTEMCWQCQPAVFGCYRVLDQLGASAELGN